MRKHAPLSWSGKPSINTLLPAFHVAHAWYNSKYEHLNEIIQAYIYQGVGQRKFGEGGRCSSHTTNTGNMLTRNIEICAGDLKHIQARRSSGMFTQDNS